MTLQQLSTAVNGNRLGGDGSFVGVSTDTRKVQAGQLFVALKGPNFDAHDFAEQAQAAAAAAMLVERQLPLSLPQVVVKDCLAALGQLGSYWHKQLQIPTLAITGSNGKTTVKEMSASIMAQSHTVFATRGNLNNDIGVPLTLLSMDESHQRAVVEMGANHHQEIAYLTHLVKPDVALVNNAGPAHLEGFGSVEGVAHAKGEIFQGLTTGGVAVFNADDVYVDVWRSLTGQVQQMTFGLKQPADVSCTWSGDLRGSDLSIQTPVGAVQCRLLLAGEHNVMNALAATAAAVASGISLEDVKKGLEALKPVSGRLQVLKGVRNATVINDTYNANPNSLHAGLEVLGKSEGDRFLVLGDMGELGPDSAQLHFAAGEDAKRSGVTRLFAIGELSGKAVEAFGVGGQHFSSLDALLEAMQTVLSAKATVLVKGSRSMRMERVVEALVDKKNSVGA